MESEHPGVTTVNRPAHDLSFVTYPDVREIALRGNTAQSSVCSKEATLTPADFASADEIFTSGNIGKVGGVGYLDDRSQRLDDVVEQHF